MGVLSPLGRRSRTEELEVTYERALRVMEEALGVDKYRRRI